MHTFYTHFFLDDIAGLGLLDALYLKHRWKIREVWTK